MISLYIILVIFEQAFLNFPLVLGAYCSISLLKVPDLSLESAFVFGAILGTRALFLTDGFLPTFFVTIVVVIAAILGGMLVGLLSSSLTQYARFPHLLSSILTTGVFHGINQFVLGRCNASISRNTNILGFIEMIRRNPELPSLAITFVFFVLIGYLFFKTQLGTALAVYGNNKNFFEHYSISTNYIFTAGILVANGLAGIAGYLDATSAGFVDINMANMKALFCVTSLILGKTFVRPKKPLSILVPIVGVFSYYFIQQLLLKVGFNLKYFTMVQSLIVLTLLITIYKKQTGKIDHLGV